MLFTTPQEIRSVLVVVVVYPFLSLSPSERFPTQTQKKKEKSFVFLEPLIHTPFLGFQTLYWFLNLLTHRLKWMWTKQRHDFDFDDSSASCQAPKTKTKTTFEYNESWEEQAFAEDAAAGRLGGCVWPPRSYSCSFCRREFRSAQALGGHMNVHRRDRARLKQSPNPQIFPFTPTLPFQFSPSHHQLSTSSTTHPSCSGFRSDELDPCPTRSDSRISCPRVMDKDHVIEAGFSDEGQLSFGLRQPRPEEEEDDDDGRDEAGAATGWKRRKTDDEKSIQFCLKSSSLVERHHLHHHHIQSEVIGLSSSSLHDVDLELRLGGLSKG